MSGRLKTLVVAAFLGLWFVGQTRKALLVDFTEDDLMNMYSAWILPLRTLIPANLTPFTSVYRPLGSVFYRVMYEVAGLHPRPFRVVAYALMVLNIWLVYRVIRAITGSAEIAVLSALLFSYHKRLFGLWVNGGTIYDILCFTFFCLALWRYVFLRETRGNVSGLGLLGFCGLYTLALNSKEMAAGLPAMLLAYELIYHRPAWDGIVRWLYDRRAVWIAAAMTVIAFRFRQTAASPFHGIPDYTVVFTVGRYLETTVPLVSQVFFLSETSLTTPLMVALFCGLWVLALVARNKAMMLGAAIIMLAPLPINFIAYRGFFVMYLPMLGWALYFGALLVCLKDWLAALTRVRVSRLIYLNAALLLATAAGLFVVEYRDDVWSFQVVDVKQVLIRGLRRDLVQIRPTMRRGGKVLFLKHAFEAESYEPLYVVRLLYHDASIAVDSAQSSVGTKPIRPADYDVVIQYCGGHYVDAGRSSCSTGVE